ncbi:MAG: porin [Aquabacterium sp.]|uniref:porin n=1 Tax=Aquabacterium sp. TaxID=1872578 RepID=UPI0025C379AD|nr:porin [Aquabacterium sp.]MBI5926053.1 porin [Aquabacterium sp.]
MFAKKNLVAVAALLAVAGAAHADVKLYGTIDAGLASLEAAHVKGVKARTTEVTSGSMMTSYIGFAGSEDLGGGLKAEFALESFLNADTGKNGPNLAGGFWGRGSWVGLTGNFGRVALGQYDNPLFTSGYTYNPFGSSMVVSPTMRHFYSGGDSAALGFDTGFVNSVTYESPVVSGFQAVAQYAAKESTAATSKNSYALMGSYNAGPLSAALTYVKGGNTSSANGTTTYTKTAYTLDQNVWNLGASYDFGVVKGFAQYTTVKTTGGLVVGDLDDDVDTPDTAELFSGANAKTKIFQVGASIPVTDKATVMVSFGQAKYKESADAASEKDEVFAIGYDYTLSKRTDVYAAFINNRHTALSSGQSYAVGIKHNF